MIHIIDPARSKALLLSRHRQYHHTFANPAANDKQGDTPEIDGHFLKYFTELVDRTRCVVPDLILIFIDAAKYGVFNLFLHRFILFSIAPASKALIKTAFVAVSSATDAHQIIGCMRQNSTLLAFLTTVIKR